MSSPCSADDPKAKTLENAKSKAKSKATEAQKKAKEVPWWQISMQRWQYLLGIYPVLFTRLMSTKMARFTRDISVVFSVYIICFMVIERG